MLSFDNVLKYSLSCVIIMYYSYLYSEPDLQIMMYNFSVPILSHYRLIKCNT